MVDSPHRRRFNPAVTRFWSFAAPAYDTAALQQLIYKPAQDEVIALLRAHHSRRVADIACGTGILAARIATEAQPEAVFGVDFAEGMLAQARRRSDSVEWMTGPAEKLPFEDASLDAVVTTSAFHFFNQPAALREFHRVLAPGGLAAVATFSPPQASPLQWLSARINPAHGPTPPAMRELFSGAGFVVDDQHRVNRPLWPSPLSDLITVGIKH